MASGNGKGQIFVKGEVISTVPESKIVETLIELALGMAEEMGVDPEAVPAGSAGRPVVSVTSPRRGRTGVALPLRSGRIAGVTATTTSSPAAARTVGDRDVAARAL